MIEVHLSNVIQIRKDDQTLLLGEAQARELLRQLQSILTPPALPYTITSDGILPAPENPIGLTWTTSSEGDAKQ